MENKELEMKDSICLDNDFRKWIIACDKLDESVQVSDPEMQKHIDTYEKHLESEKNTKEKEPTNLDIIESLKRIAEDANPNIDNILTLIGKLK